MKAKELALFILLGFVSITQISASAKTATLPNQLVIDATITKADCDDNNGEIELEISGGTAPYTITPSDLTNLSAGDYDITITDSGSCIVDTTITVGENNNLSHFVDVLDDVSCSGNEPSDIFINIAGGSGSYLVLIDTNPSISEVSPGVFSTMLPGGSYGITITDVNDNCMLVDNFAVGQPSPIDIETTIIEIDSCSGAIQMLDIVVSGGSPPYNVMTDQQSNGVLVTAIDDEGCSEDLFVNNPEIEDALVISNILVYEADPGEDNGAIDITVSGGTPPYFYRWTDSDGNEISTDEDIEDLLAGTYQVHISDSKSCSILSGDIVIDETTSTAGPGAQYFSVYPNPADGDCIYIDTDIRDRYTVSLLSRDGRLIRQEVFTHPKRMFRLGPISSGLYYLRITNANGVELHSLFKQ